MVSLSGAIDPSNPPDPSARRAGHDAHQGRDLRARHGADTRAQLITRIRAEIEAGTYDRSGLDAEHRLSVAARNLQQALDLTA